MKKRRKKGKFKQNKQDKKQIEIITNYLIKNLKNEGIIIQKYKSKSSLSVYLKLDYGVLNSIRISDHKGKKHLNYKYNILTICPEPISTINKTRFGDVIRHYFPINNKEELLQTILQDRNHKISSYGLQRYQTYMNKEIASNHGRKGFWQSSKMI